MLDLWMMLFTVVFFYALDRYGVALERL